MERLQRLVICYIGAFKFRMKAVRFVVLFLVKDVRGIGSRHPYRLDGTDKMYRISPTYLFVSGRTRGRRPYSEGFQSVERSICRMWVFDTSNTLRGPSLWLQSMRIAPPH